MRWLLDENIPTTISDVLREQGHDVLHVAATSPGMTDSEVLAVARAQDRVLVFFDRDHGDLIFGRHAAAPPAVVYIRLDRPLPEHIQTLARVLTTLRIEELTGHFTVITLGGMRQRSLPTHSS